MGVKPIDTGAQQPADDEHIIDSELNGGIVIPAINAVDVAIIDRVDEVDADDDHDDHEDEDDDDDDDDEDDDASDNNALNNNAVDVNAVHVAVFANATTEMIHSVDAFINMTNIIRDLNASGTLTGELQYMVSDAVSACGDCLLEFSEIPEHTAEEYARFAETMTSSVALVNDIISSM